MTPCLKIKTRATQTPVYMRSLRRFHFAQSWGLPPLHSWIVTFLEQRLVKTKTSAMLRSFLLTPQPTH